MALFTICAKFFWTHRITFSDTSIGSQWHGWHSIEQLIVLGDRASSTGFDINGDKPSASQPFGNPAYPGLTVTNGANWVDYLTYEKNESVIQTLDLAVGGATIDKTLIMPGMPAYTIKSFKEQVEEVAAYEWSWTGDKSLFTVWFGVNDITAYTNETRGNFAAEFEEYAPLLDRLYNLGARNFLIFNAPPIDKLPIYELSGTADWKVVNAEWNVNITATVDNFKQTHEATVFFFDACKLFNTIVDDPCTFEESCGFKVTQDSCLGYAWGAPTPDYFDPQCAYSVDKYLWINPLHPSTRMHNAIAKAVVDALKAG